MESYHIVYVTAAAVGALLVVKCFHGALWKRVSIGAVIGLAVVAAL